MFNPPEPIKSELLEVLQTPEGEQVAAAFRKEFYTSFDFGKAWEKAAIEAENRGIGVKVSLAFASDLVRIGVPIVLGIIKYIMAESNKPK